jgi:hypothetical protein
LLKTIDFKLSSPGFVHLIVGAEEAAVFSDEFLKSHFEISFSPRFTWDMKLIKFLPYKIIAKIHK